VNTTVLAFLVSEELHAPLDRRVFGRSALQIFKFKMKTTVIQQFDVLQSV